jgi:uncharacterized membrane protein YeaQ/YmgE (transglycosylase-associated protein family)
VAAAPGLIVAPAGQNPAAGLRRELSDMQVNDILSAILIGALIGTLGRLVIPGRQRIGVFITVLIGIGAAWLGAKVANYFSVNDTPASWSWFNLHWDWWALAIQVGFAVIGIGLAAALSHTIIAWRDDRPRKRKPRKSRASAAKED